VSLESVRTHLAAHGLADGIQVFTESSATVELAAARVGTAPARIAKTLAFVHPADPDRAMLIVAAGDAKVSGGAFKRQFGGKGSMVPADRLEELTGHPMGGVCPFANPPSAEVWLDESLRRFDVVYPAAGSHDSAVPIPVDRLEQVSGARGWVDICTAWRDPAG
jgi:prolyl-tRNA editing enzyme YbaK/EbsC (Cys-tRNA(Pro) deacylase)